MSAFRVMGAAVAAAAVFLTVKVAPIAVGWVAGHEGVKWLTTRTPTTADIEAMLAKSGATFYVILKDNFPDDYRALVEKLAATAGAARSKEESDRLGFEATSSIRHKYAASLLNAPDENLHEIFATQIEMMNAVASRETPALCALFASQGGAALKDRMSGYMVLADNAGASILRGIAAGLKTPDPVGSVTDDDWVVIAKRYLADGGTDASLKIIGEQLQTDPGYCTAIISFMGSIQAEPSAAGHRVRASMAYEMAAQ